MANYPGSEYYENIIECHNQAQHEWEILTTIDSVLMKIEARLDAIEEVLGITTVVTDEELNDRDEPPGARLFLDMAERLGNMDEVLESGKRLYGD